MKILVVEDEPKTASYLRNGLVENGFVASPIVTLLGIASFVGFAVMLTRVDSAFAGRAYAEYGGIYIAASLIWLWSVEGQRPTVTDLCRPRYWRRVPDHLIRAESSVSWRARQDSNLRPRD
jgi:drug/metabolite transporter superfamily protein YnfA